MDKSKISSIEKAIALVKKAAKQGNTAVAIEICTAILQRQPNNAFAKKMVRTLQNNTPPKTGETDDPPQGKLAQLGKLVQACKYTKAEESSRQLLENHPKSSLLYNLLGAALQGQGNLVEAASFFDKALQLKPDLVEGYWNLGNVLMKLGKLQGAVSSYDSAINIKHDYAEAHHNRGLAKFELGRLNEAIESYTIAIKFKPNLAGAYGNRGNALLTSGQLEEALQNFNKLIELSPRLALAYNSRGSVLRKLSLYKEASEDFKKAIQLKSGYAMAYNNLGLLLQDFQRPTEAIAHYNDAITLKPGAPEPYYNKGVCLKSLGKLEEAVHNFDKVIELAPTYARAHRSLTTIKKYSLGDPHALTMKNLLASAKLKDSDRVQILFGLAKVHEDIGEYGNSYNYLKEGNDARRLQLNYDITKDRNLFAEIKGNFERTPTIPDRSGHKFSSLRSIFIVGMPRSGTSLVEQILASHSEVYGAGELGFLEDLAVPLLQRLSKENINQKSHGLTDNDISDVRNGYLEKLGSLPFQESIITDKMPLNFKYAGIILSAFPEAKIIHTTRDPIATCWSIYKQYFVTSGNAYGYSLQSLVEYYNLYKELMSFWHDKFPGKIYDLCYEDLTENQEGESRKLLEICGLEWEDQCLDFHKSKRAVSTASSTQVRQKMYQGSSEAWRNYEQHLKPLIDAFYETR